MLTCYVGILRPDSEDGTRVGIKPFRHLQRDITLKYLVQKDLYEYAETASRELKLSRKYMN